MRIQTFVQRNVSPELFKALVSAYTRAKALKFGRRVRWRADGIEVIDGSRLVRISQSHYLYAPQAVEEFDYFFSAVESVHEGDFDVVDYSYPHQHRVIGFDLHPVLFPSVAEPIATTTQYMEFADLHDGMTVLDLGAYSGLTSIVFQEAVGSNGRVVAVEADEQNIECIEQNFACYEKIRNKKIELLKGAVWENGDGLEFSSDGNMGAAAASIVGKVNRGTVRKVPSFTLSSIVELFALDRLDFVKCDVEGAEAVLFKDRTFFERFKPRMILETHLVGGVSTVDKCKSDLSDFGYTFQEVAQTGGSPTPLLECYPPVH